MKRSNIEIEIIEIFLAIALAVLTVILLFRSSDLTILFPIAFGLGAILSVLYGLEGVLYNKSRVIKPARLIAFSILGALLLFFTVISAITILKVN